MSRVCSGLKTRFYILFQIFETKFRFYENWLVFSIFNKYGTIQTSKFKFEAKELKINKIDIKAT